MSLTILYKLQSLSFFVPGFKNDWNVFPTIDPPMEIGKDVDSHPERCQTVHNATLTVGFISAVMLQGQSRLVIAAIATGCQGTLVQGFWIEGKRSRISNTFFHAKGRMG